MAEKKQRTVEIFQLFGKLKVTILRAGRLTALAVG
jgi:hypothetical protein